MCTQAPRGVRAVSPDRPPAATARPREPVSGGADGGRRGRALGTVGGGARGASQGCGPVWRGLRSDSGPWAPPCAVPWGWGRCARAGHCPGGWGAEPLRREGSQGRAGSVTFPGS